LAAALRVPHSLKAADREELDVSRSIDSLGAALAALASDEPRLLAQLKPLIPARFQGVVSPEDVFQEMRLSLLNAQFVPIGDWDAYARVALRNALIQVLRRARAQRRGGHVQIRALPSRSHLGLMRHGAPALTPSGEVAGDEARAALLSALANLAEPERIALCLCHLEGLSRKEVAARMKRTEAAVNGLVFRAQQKLRHLLGDPERLFSDVPDAPGAPS
jgi:RNA polymerase sigma factor (sigma-70 family)